MISETWSYIFRWHSCCCQRCVFAWAPYYYQVNGAHFTFNCTQLGEVKSIVTDKLINKSLPFSLEIEFHLIFTKCLHIQFYLCAVSKVWSQSWSASCSLIFSISAGVKSGYPTTAYTRKCVHRRCNNAEQTLCNIQCSSLSAIRGMNTRNLPQKCLQTLD